MATTTINTNTYWDTSKSPYVVNGNLEIAKGVTLQIASGVTVKMGTGTNYSGIQVNGTLSAYNVTFTSTDDYDSGGTIKKYWSGISSGSTGVLDLNNVTIKYAGSTALAINGKADLSNSTISNCTGTGINISVSAANQDVTIYRNNITTTGTLGVGLNTIRNVNLSFSNNVITSGKDALSLNLSYYMPLSAYGVLDNNTLNGEVMIFGTLQTDIALPQHKYNVSGLLTIPVDKTLNIAAGSTLVETSVKPVEISVAGTLNANGASGRPILITGSGDPEMGGTKITYWTGIVLAQTGTLNLNYTNLRYTGSYGIAAYGTLSVKNSTITNSQSYSITISTNNKNIEISNNTINYSRGYGINIDNISGGQFTFQGNKVINSFSEDSLRINLSYYQPSSVIGGLANNTFDGDIIISGTLQRNITLPEHRYKVPALLTIPVDKTLNIAAGSTLVETSVKPVEISVSGTLNANGVSGRPILITSSGDPELGGTKITYWTGIVLLQTGTLNLNHTNLRYTGSYGIAAYGTISVKNSSITNSQSYSININTNDKNIEISNTTIDYSRSYGINIDAINGGEFIFQNNKILNSFSEYSLRINLSYYKPLTVIGGLDNNNYDKVILLTGTLQNDLYLPKRRYDFTSVTIPINKTLTVAPGSKLVAYNATTALIVDGTLVAVGTPSNRILFSTKNDPELGGINPINWEGITINKTGKVDLNYIDIRYTNVYAINNIGGELSIINSRIENISRNGIGTSSIGRNINISNNTIAGVVGLYVGGLQNGTFEFKNNTFTQTSGDSISLFLSYYEPIKVIGGFAENNVQGSILLSGWLKQDLILPKHNYNIQSIQIVTGSLLRITQGSVLKVSGQIFIYGALHAIGTASESIIFTGWNDPDFDTSTSASIWYGIHVGQTGTLSMDHATIRNAGQSVLSNNRWKEYFPVECLGKLVFTNSTIENPLISCICFNTTYQPVLKNNLFVNIRTTDYWMLNRNYNLTIKAENQYWGSPEGPCVDEIGFTTTGGKISRGIQYIPFSTNGQSSNAQMQVQLLYPGETIDFHNVSPKVSIQGGTNSSYYVEILCSWDRTTWYNKGSDIINMSQKTGYAIFNFTLYEAGRLYTKAVVYDHKGGTVLKESEISQNIVDVWYYLSTKDKDNVLTQTYYSVSSNTTQIVAIKKSETEEYWKEYLFDGSKWIDRKKEYVDNPISDTPSVNNVKNVKQLELKKDDLKCILDTSKFTRNEEKGIYIGVRDYWQKRLSVSNLTDVFSQQPGVVIDWEPIPFVYNNKKYLISMWKGQYYLLTGGEIALYEADSNEEEYIPSSMAGMHIKFALQTSTTIIATHEEDSSWLTAYKVGSYTNKSSLKMTVSITFPNVEMCNAFATAIRLKRYTVTITDMTASFICTGSTFQNNNLLRESPTLWTAVQKNLCENYQLFEIQPQNAPQSMLLAVGNEEVKLDVFVDAVEKSIEPTIDYTELMQDKIKLDFEINKNPYWIYCNYPEKLRNEDFADNPYARCLNKVNVYSGNGQIFYSYQGHNMTEPYNFGILVTTASTTPVKFIIENYGHSEKTNDIIKEFNTIARESWKMFFNTPPAKKEFMIDKDNLQSGWICNEGIGTNTSFSGNLRFYSEGSVTIMVCIYKGYKEALTGQEKLVTYDFNKEKYKDHLEEFKTFDKDTASTELKKLYDEYNTYKAYSGYGKGYFYRVKPIIINLSALLNKPVSFVTNSRVLGYQRGSEFPYMVNYVPDLKPAWTFIDELTPITLSDRGLGSTTLIAENEDRFDGVLHNVGNWSTQYHFNITFVWDNDAETSENQYEIEYTFINKGVKDKTGEYVFQSKMPVVQYVDNGQTVVWGESAVSSGINAKVDNDKCILPFEKTFTLTSKGQRIQFQYQYIFGTNSTEPMIHAFRIKKNK